MYVGYFSLLSLSFLLCLQYDLLFLRDIGFVFCSKTNVTLQQNQYPIDTVNTPSILVENTSCGIIMSVSHTPNQACLRTLSNVELGAATLIQHYTVFSVGLGLGYGTLTQCKL